MDLAPSVGSTILRGINAMAKAVKQPDMQEIATTLNGRDITRGYVLPQILMLPQDTVLRQRAGGDLRLYEDLLRDDQVGTTFAQRRLAVQSKEWYVEPGGKRAIDRQAADSLQAILTAIEFNALTDKMLYGIFYGYSVGECLYARDGREVILDKIKVRSSRRFRFDGAERLRLLTFENMMPGELLPPRKMWIYAHGATNDDEPYGLGLGHWLYWPVLFKRNGMRFWLIFLEKFGQPTAKGTYPRGATTQERQKLLDALAAITTDSGVIMPEGMTIDLIEAARSGTADYATLTQRMNDAISKLVIGHTAAADATPGRLGGETIADSVRADLVTADAARLCGSFNATVARWLTDWNYPGAAYPQVWRRTEDPTDQVNRSTALANLAKLGYRPTLSQVEDEFGAKFEDIKASPAAPAAAANTFAEPVTEVPVTTTTDLQSEQINRDLMPVMNEWVGQVAKLAQSATSLTQLRDQLIGLYPDLSPDKFTLLMEQALVAADLAGRYDILEQAGCRP